MKNTQTLTFSEQKYTYNILNSFSAVIKVKENPYILPLEHLFKMAARINKKRSFLFVSNLLGKHLPIDPKKGLLTAEMLAATFMETTKGLDIARREEFRSSLLSTDPSLSEIRFYGSPLIIGFAETATALGHAFFDCFPEADYVHTTREELTGQKSVITFEEEHSHATAHRCYLPVEMIANEREIILVDDELTTGKTALNIIRAIHGRFPRKEYTVVAILDWRSAADRKTFEKVEKQLGIKIQVSSLLSGSFEIKALNEIVESSQLVETIPTFEPQIEYLNMSAYVAKINAPSLSTSQAVNETPFIKETGRFGLKGEDAKALHEGMKQLGTVLLKKRDGKRTLCLGTGEFMYIPMKISAEMGSGVHFHSTTRSPIYVKNELGYGARFGLSFPNPEDDSINHFVYNIPPGQYDEIFLFFEREVCEANIEPLLQQLKKTLVKSIKIVFFSQIRGGIHE